MRPKIVCVGMPKTGTSSLGKALTLLGYTLIGWKRDWALMMMEERINELIRIFSEVDVCVDFPWAIAYKKWDTVFPGSKFILTIRDESSWLASNLKHFDPDPENSRVNAALVGGAFRKWAMGYAFPQENTKHYLDFYRRHNEGVIDYFRNDGRLLVMDLEAGDGWKKLCLFLDLPLSELPFPHVNRADGSQ